MDNSNINMIIGIVVIVVVIIVAVGLGVGLGMKKDPVPIQQNTDRPKTTSASTSTTPTSNQGVGNGQLDIQTGFKPTISQVGPVDLKNVLNVQDGGYADLSSGPYQYMTISQKSNVKNEIKNTGFFQKGTYSNIGTDSKVFCREVGGPRFVSCGVPGNPYKYMPPNEKSGPISDPGYEAFRGMFIINGTGDSRLDGKTVFCRGVGNDPKNPQMSCIGLNADGSWDYTNQNIGLGKLGNALDYFTPPPIPHPSMFEPGSPGCPVQ